MEILWILFPLLLGWFLDLLLGDPQWLPHPIVAFGKAISFCEKRLNKGEHRSLKGAFTAIGLILASFFLTFFIIKGALFISPWLKILVETILIFYCLAGTTLIKEVLGVFRAVDISLEDGRRQISRIVGRDTDNLSEQEIRTAALETLAENLSDGVIAPLFWYLVAGVPGMIAYKMANTLDSMIGYKNERYRAFGCVAARVDDFLNFIPARLTALLMILSNGKLSLLKFVEKYGPEHASPNSGYPEAALAAILDCRFGGTHDYFGESVQKPHIGTNNRPLTTNDMEKAISINRYAEVLMVIFVATIKVISVIL